MIQFNHFKMQVLQTTDYHIFKQKLGNRHVTELGVNRVMGSMRQGYLEIPIDVNEDMEVIDGQHRLEACKRLELPVFYIVRKGWGVDEANKLNVSRSNWGIRDYMISFAEQGIKKYQSFRSLSEDNGISVSITLAAWNGVSTLNSQARYNLKNGLLKDLSTEEISMAKEKLERINEMQKYTRLWKGTNFGYAMLRLMDHQDYDHERMVGRLETERMRIDPHSTIEGFVKNLQDIYNHSYGKKNRVKFLTED